MPVAVLALMGVLVTKAVDWVRHLRARDWNAVVTQAVVWGAGVGAAFLLAASDFADKVTFDELGGVALADLNGPSLVFVGMAVLSGFSKLVDLTKAVDSSQSAAVPPLVPTKPPAPDTANERYLAGRRATDPGHGPA